MSKRWFWVACAAVTLTIGTTAPAAARGGPYHDFTNPARVEAFTTAAAVDHLMVTEGYFQELRIVDLVCKNIFPLCNGNNSSNPYMVALMVDAGPSGQGSIDPSEDLIPPFKMRADEAIVLIGATPPPVAYFSYTPFIYDRYFPEEGITRKFFNSLIDPLNLGVLKLPGGKDDPYDQSVAIIFTSDRRTADRVERALHSAGYPHGAVNVAPMPSALATFATPSDTAHADSFLILLRMGIPLHGTDLASYLRNWGPDLHTRIFRITPTTYEEQRLRPLPVPALRPRGTGQTELELSREARQIRAKLISTYATKGYAYVDLKPSLWLEESYSALQHGTDTLGESADTPYLKSDDFGLSGDDFVVAYGANHVATGKATYANAAFYEKCADCGLYSVNDRQMNGSAVAWLPANDRSAEKMYVHIFSRVCESLPTCTPVTADACPAPDKGAFLGFRAYYEAETLIGPAHRELLWDRAILFTKNPVLIGNVTQYPPAAAAILPGQTTTIGFDLSGPAGGTLSWTASLVNAKCGTVDPKQGTVASGARVTFTFTACKGPDTAEILIGAADQNSRPAQVRGVVVEVGAPQ